jgi:DNA-binding NarL/FixJ family response regulator
MAGKIKVLLVDDHVLLRSTLRRCLQESKDISVTGVADDAGMALDVFAQTDVDVVVMDIDMPGLLCFEAVREMRKQRSDCRVVFLSAFFNDRYIDDALACGALSYLTKDESPEVLVAAIRNAARGVSYFSPRVRSRLVIAEGDQVTLSRKTGRTRATQLTDRELEVLRYLARGLAKKEIASLIHRSYATVDKHAENLMNKLGIHDRVELTRYAIREGLAEA